MVVLLEAEMLGSDLTDISLLEAMGLSRAVQRIADLRGAGLPQHVPHPDLELVLPEVLSWLSRRDLR